MRTIALVLLTFFASYAAAPNCTLAQNTEGITIVVESETTDLHLEQGLRSELAPLAYMVLSVISRVGSQEAMTAFLEVVRDARPETTELDYTVNILDNYMRMDFGGSSMIGHVDTEGNTDWKILDQASGQLLDSEMFNLGLAANESSEVFSELEMLRSIVNNESSVTPRGETRQIAGHQARKYEYRAENYLEPIPIDDDGNMVTIMILNFGSVWVASDSPFADDPVVHALFSGFSNSLRSTGLASEQREEIRNAGMLLGHEDETRVIVDLIDSGGDNAKVLQQASSKTEIVEMSRTSVDPTLFSAITQEKQRCDCSCRAFGELQAIGKLSKREQDAHPKAMTLSMCAPKCAMRWARCGQGN